MVVVSWLGQKTRWQCLKRAGTERSRTMKTPLSSGRHRTADRAGPETGDLVLLRRLADAGSKDALDQLVESAAEQEDSTSCGDWRPSETRMPRTSWPRLEGETDA